MIQCINYCLFNCLVRIVEEGYRFSLVFLLDDTFLDNIRLDIVQRLFNHIGHRAHNLWNLNHIVGIFDATFRKNNNIYLGRREKFGRILTEHHGSYILDQLMFSGSYQQVHLRQ